MTFPSTPTTDGLSLLLFAHLILLLVSLRPLSFALFTITALLTQSSHSEQQQNNAAKAASSVPAKCH
jgi:flagellar basal body-associated protein FliL